MAVSCTHADASCSDIDICCWKASDGDTTLSPIAPRLIGKTPVFLDPMPVFLNPISVFLNPMPVFLKPPMLLGVQVLDNAVATSLSKTSNALDGEADCVGGPIYL